MSSETEMGIDTFVTLNKHGNCWPIQLCWSKSKWLLGVANLTFFVTYSVSKANVILWLISQSIMVHKQQTNEKALLSLSQALIVL